MGLGRVRIALLAATLLLVTLSVQAEPSPSGDDAQAAAKVLFLRGTKAYQAGHYDDAIADYLGAYQAKPSPDVLFDVAEIYRAKKKDRERAANYYRRYLKDVPTGRESDRARKWLAKLRPSAGERGGPSASAASPQAAPAEFKASKTSVASATQPQEETPASVAAESDPPRRLAAPESVPSSVTVVTPEEPRAPGRKWLWPVVGVVAGVVVAGVVVGLAVGVRVDPAESLAEFKLP